VTYVAYDRKDSDGVKGFLFKILDIQTGVYYVEFPVGDVSVFVPLKYYKYRREDRKAGGDSGQFHVPQFVAVGLYEWGIQPGYVYVRIWKIG
jgi:hypothetical protein